MEIRADLNLPAWQHPEGWTWVDSPQPGVARVMLDRVGDEVAVATSIVRYQPGSRFPAHLHARGEEFIVLEGEFADEHGRYPAGSYVRNPPGSRHAPFSDPGCMIWVKLRQFQDGDQTTLRTRLDMPIPSSGTNERVLHEFGDERVRIVAAAAGEELLIPAAAVPQEVLVLEGAVTWREETFRPHGWIRQPAGHAVQLTADAPARIFSKTRPPG